MTTHSTSQNNANHPQVTERDQADESKLEFTVLGRMRKVARFTNWYNLGGDMVSVVNIFKFVSFHNIYPMIAPHIYWHVMPEMFQLVINALVCGPCACIFAILYKFFLHLLPQHTHYAQVYIRYNY